MDNTDSKNFFHQVLSADLVAYMKTIGLDSVGKKNGMAYFMSPFRKHEYGDPGLIVDMQKQIWRCNDSGKKGNIIDLTTELFDMSIPEVMDHFKSDLTILPEAPEHPEVKDVLKYSNLQVNSQENIISDKRFENFFDYHGMKLSFVEQYLSQYECTDKITGEKVNAVGLHRQQYPYHLLIVDDHLPQKAGYLGSEVSDEISYAFSNRNHVVVDVFSSVLDMLHLKNITGADLTGNNTIILSNDYAFESARNLMEAHKQVNLFLHNDHRSNQYKGYAQWLSPKYRDYSPTYGNWKSLSQLVNIRAIEIRDQQTQQRKRGPEGL